MASQKSTNQAFQGLWRILFAHIIPLNPSLRFKRQVYGQRLTRKDSDLTLDCNVQRLPLASGDSYPRIRVQGIDLAGGNILLKRVRVINWGTRTPFCEYGHVINHDTETFEDFPIFARIADNSSRITVEDCITDWP